MRLVPISDTRLGHNFLKCRLGDQCNAITRAVGRTLEPHARRAAKNHRRIMDDRNRANSGLYISNSFVDP